MKKITKILYQTSFFILALILVSIPLCATIDAQDVEITEPSLEQFSKMAKCKISFEFFCEDENFDRECWEFIEDEINALIDKCNEYSEDKINELYQAVYNVIERIRNARSISGSKGIYGLLNVACGDPVLQPA